MASNLASELSGTQVVELVMRLGKGGLTVEKAKELMGDDKKMEEFVKNGLKKDPYLTIPAAGAYARYAAQVENHYRLSVSYAKLPGVKALEKKFSKDGVSSLYDGRAWTRHKSCASIDETPGEREFLVAEIPAEFLGKRIDSVEDALAEYFDKLGYRFAIETEAVEFAHAQPELQRKNWILALGSSAFGDDDYRCVTMLDEDGCGRILVDCWVDIELDENDRLLLVRK